jgi:transcriptional regulator with XRE-family HTH domain
LELTQAQLGKRLRVSDQTIANYERENTADLGPADPLMRGFYLLSVLPEETRIEVLRDIIEKLAKEQSAKVPDPPRRKIVSRWKECARKAAE